MSIRSVKYIVTITDMRHDVVLLEGARVGELGMVDILQKFTNLNLSGRDHFVSRLKATGSWSLGSTISNGATYQVQANKFVNDFEPPMGRKDKMSEKEYEVDIFNKMSQTMVVQNSTMSRDALCAILEYLMDMSQDSRNLAFDELDKKNHIKLYARPLSALPFDIWIRRISKREHINWERLIDEWQDHWGIRTNNVDLNRHFDAFWADRGGRERYFMLDAEGKEQPRVHLGEWGPDGEIKS